MDLNYFKDHICEELDGARDYTVHAIEIKPMYASWGKNLIDMSAQELVHAGHLYNMFLEYCTKIGGGYVQMPEYVTKVKDEVTEKYTRCSAEVKMLHEMFSR